MTWRLSCGLRGFAALPVLNALVVDAPLNRGGAQAGRMFSGGEDKIPERLSGATLSASLREAGVAVRESGSVQNPSYEASGDTHPPRNLTRADALFAEADDLGVAFGEGSRTARHDKPS
jgi:hypothetical protein